MRSVRHGILAGLLLVACAPAAPASAASVRECGRTRNAERLVAYSTSCARARAVEARWIAISTRGGCGRGCQIGRYHCGAGSFTFRGSTRIYRLTCRSRSAFVRWYVNTNKDP